MNFENFSPQLLRYAIEKELQFTTDTKMASMIALSRLKKDSQYYHKKYGYIEMDMQKARVTKYVKRVPKPSGKGYYYFYTQQQFKEYKEKGTIPKEKPTKEGGLLSGIMSFFGIKDNALAKQKVEFDYKKHDIQDKFDISVKSWTEHLAEYFNNKTKWDKLFLQKLQSQQKVKKTEGVEKKKAINSDITVAKKIKKESKKSGFKHSVMYSIYNIYKKEARKNGKDTKDESGTKSSRLPTTDKPVFRERSKEFALQNVQERKPTDNRKVDVFTGSSAGERPGRDVRLTKGQIKDTRQQIIDLLASKTNEEMTDVDKNLLRQYEGAGGIKEENKTAAATLYEYYTPRNVVNKIWELTEKYTGKTKKNVLEPSAGIGRFAENQELHDFTMFELDETSARINKILFPDAKVENKPFQELFMQGGVVKPGPYSGKKFGVTIGNPPYGAYSGFHKGIGEGKDVSRYEEYFIDRGLDALEPGGIMAYIVPSGFLRGNKYSDVKSRISKKGKLMEAYRLPNGTFSTTGVGTDIIIIRKEEGKIDDFLDDKYFNENPDKILGDETTRTGKFGPEQYVALREGETYDSVVDKINIEDVPVVPVNQKTENESIQEDITLTKTYKPKAKKEKVISEDNFETMPEVETDSIKSFSEKYNKKYNPEELNIWKNTDYSGKIDTDKLSSKEKKYLEDSDNIFLHNNEYVHKTNYASGNIYKKLTDLELEKSSMSEEKYEKQKKILEAVIPDRKTVKNFSISPISDFAKNYEVEDESGETESLIDRFFQWATGRKSSYSYMSWDGGVTQHDIPSGMSWSDVYDYINQNPVRAGRGGDKQTNQLIAAKTKELRRDVSEKLFKRFLETGLEHDEQQNIEDTYNKQFNSYTPPDYSEMPIFIDGISTKFKGNDLIVKEKQMQGASFLSNKGNGILAYDVGVGKTMTGIIATVNQIQTGRAKKPVVVVPKAVYENWLVEIRELFPNLKINGLGNLGKDFVSSDLKIEDGSLSVMTYQGLQKLTFKPETIHGDLISDMVDSQQSETEAMSERDKALMREKIYEKLGMATKTKTAVVSDLEGEEFVEGSSHYLEDLGFDHITVDEVHNFKNVFGQAKPAKSKTGKSVANEFQGLTGGQSAQAMKMFALSQVIQKNNDDRNIFGLSATPFTNSPLEIYNLLSIVARKRLKELGIYNLHEFMATFAKLKSEWAVKPSGQVERKSVMKEFQNLSALQSLIREYIDKIDGEEAGVIRPNKNTHIAEVNMTPLQKAIYATEAKRFDLNPKDNPGATLKAINNMRMASLSPSLLNFEDDDLYVGTGIPELVKKDHLIEDSPKLKFTFDSVANFHKEKPDLGQVIYMPRGVKQFDIAVNNLIEKGIPKKAIATISSKTSNKKKEKIMKDFNDPNGTIKVIIGSETIKEGVNLNGNTAVLYNTLLGWNPSETTQVEGRIWRQGNKQGIAHIVYPQLIDSVDAAMYQKHDEKRQRFNALWSYKGDALNVEDINPEELKFELIKDPERRAKFMMDLKMEDIDTKKRDKRIFIDILNKYKNDLEVKENEKKSYQRNVPQYKIDVVDAEKEVDKAENELKEYKKSRSKENPKNESVIARYNTEIKATKEKLKDEKKYLRDAERDVLLTEKAINGIQNKLNDMGIGVSDIDSRVALEEEEVKKIHEEGVNIKENREKYVAQAKKDIEASKKTVPALKDSIKNHVDLVVNNLKPMEEVLQAMVKSMNLKFIKISDNLYIDLNKARVTKYVKRVPKPSGKGYIYFYNQKQIKEYKEKGTIPKEKPTKEGGLLSGIMSFFGFKDDKQAQDKVSSEYVKHKDKLEGISESDFGNHLNEYLSNKEKWDAKISGKGKSEKKLVSKKTGKIVKREKGDKKESSGFKLSIMKAIAGIYGEDYKKEIKEPETEKKEKIKGFKQYTLEDETKIYTGSEEKISNKTKKKVDIFPSQLEQASIFFADNVIKQGKFTNGAIAVLDENLADKLNEQARNKYTGVDYSKDSSVDIDRIVPTDLEGYSEPKFSFAKTPVGEKEDLDFTRLVYKKSDGENIVFKSSFIDLFKKNFPNGKLLVRETNEPAIFQVNGVTKGVIMPANIKSDKKDKYSDKVLDSIKDKKDDFEKHAESVSKKKLDGIYSPDVLQNPDGTYKKNINHKGLNKKNFKNPIEKKIFEKLNVKNKIVENTKMLKPYFDNSKEGQDSGVWTDSRMMILDKDITDEIYNTNKQRKFLRMKNINNDILDEDVISNIEEESTNYQFPNWKQVIPEESKINKEEAKFTGDYNSDSKKLKYTDGEYINYFPADHMATIKSKFPDSKLHLSGNMSPAVFKVGNDIKALLMPLKSDDEQMKDKMEKATLFKTPMNKAFIKISDNLYIDLNKAKAVPVGTVSKDGTKKKVSEGKWVSVKKDKPGKETETKPKEKPEEKPKEKEKPKLNEQNKGKIKDALKKFANILAEVLSGKDVVQPTGAAVEQAGESAATKKSNTKKKDDKNNGKQNFRRGRK
jgi:hypothetical protein